MARGIIFGSLPLTFSLLTCSLALLRTFTFPAFFAQPDATALVSRLVMILLAYIALSLWVTRKASSWDPVAVRTVLLIAIAAGLTEILNVALENGIPFPQSSQTVPIALTVAVFATWSLVGFLVTRLLHSWRVGVLAAVACGILSMLIGVAGGTFLELFVIPVHPDVVATWAEFKRSGWTDPAAFQIANTLDSAFSHLLLSPLVASIFGAIGSALASF